MAEQKTILVVEDEEPLQEAIQVKLKATGKYRILAAYSAEEAFDILAAEKTLPALVWLDLLLPGMGGFQFLQKLRSAPQWKNLPVMVVSVSNSLEKIHGAFDLNVIDYIVKSHQSLEDIVKKLDDYVKTNK